MIKNPYESPKAEDARLGGWRRAAAALLYAPILLLVLLAVAMLTAGVRWLIIEYRGGHPFSLSLALLSGSALSASVAGGIFWLARRIAR